MSLRALSSLPGSCHDCGAWAIVLSSGRCRGCQFWHDKKRTRPPGPCTRCRHELPLRRGLCRGCCLHMRFDGPEAGHEPSFTQLWIADPLPASLRTPRETDPAAAQRIAISSKTVPARLTNAQCPFISQPVVPGQQLLFPMSRDWSPLVDIDRRSRRLPELSMGPDPASWTP